MTVVVTIAVLLLLVPVAILLVGLGNVRRNRARSANAESKAGSPGAPQNRRHVSRPLPKPPALPEDPGGKARLVRPFGLKRPMKVVDPADGPRMM